MSRKYSLFYHFAEHFDVLYPKQQIFSREALRTKIVHVDIFIIDGNGIANGCQWNQSLGKNEPVDDCVSLQIIYLDEGLQALIFKELKLCVKVVTIKSQMPCVEFLCSHTNIIQG